MIEAPRSPASLGAERVLVIAPHPDDESLGCGGLIALLASLGARIATVFVTDGGASHPHSPSWPRARLAVQRRREAGAALEALGVGDHPRHFLDLPDAAMPARESDAWNLAAEELAGLVRRFGPDLVLMPWRRDPHGDHRDSFVLARAALARARSTPQTLEYAVWLDELGRPEDHPRPGEAERIVFDVAAARNVKRAAVARHLSQTTALIDDDPQAFRLSAATIDRLTGPHEIYWRALP